MKEWVELIGMWLAGMIVAGFLGFHFGIIGALAGCALGGPACANVELRQAARNRETRRRP